MVKKRRESDRFGWKSGAQRRRSGHRVRKFLGTDSHGIQAESRYGRGDLLEQLMAHGAVEGDVMLGGEE
jgi:hypothetical protein